MTTYYTLDKTTNDLVRLVPPIDCGGRAVLHPTAAQAAQYGAYPRNDDAPMPTPPEGKQWQSSTGWTLRDGMWCANYEGVDIPPPTLDEYDAVMEDHLAQERSARGYTTREPDAYLSSANTRWAQDAHDWVAHRDAVMAYALELINAVSAGQREPPTIEEFRVGLPQITWSYQEDS